MKKFLLSFLLLGTIAFAATTNIRDLDDSYFLKVNSDGSINIGSSVLPDGAATSANQIIEIAHLAAIEDSTSSTAFNTSSSVTQLGEINFNTSSTVTELIDVNSNLAIIQGKQDTGNASLDSIDTNTSSTATSTSSTVTELVDVNSNLVTIQGKQDTGNAFLDSIEENTSSSVTQLVEANGSLSSIVTNTSSTAANTSSSVTQLVEVNSNLVTIQGKQDTGNASLSSITIHTSSTVTNQTNGAQKSQQVDALGNVMPAGDVIARSVFVTPGDGITPITVKPASSSSVASDTSLVTALSPNSPLPAGTNTLGTVKAQLQDNAGTAITAGYGAAANAIRTASQIGNTTGQADFSAGSSTAQTLRTTSNITRNGTELDYNFGAASDNTPRVSALPGNATGIADFAAGTTGAQTPRVSANITRNGTELSYSSGATDANTLRAAANLYDGSANAIGSNFGSSSSALRVAALPGNASGLADFNSGATSAQTPRAAVNLYDSAGNALTSRSFDSVRPLDVFLSQLRAGTATRTTVTPTSNTSTQLLAANANRKFVYLINNSGAAFFIAFGTTATINNGIEIPANGNRFIMEATSLYTGAINAIVGSNNRTIEIYEFTQ